MGKKLTKVEGGVINQHGVFISDEQAKAIRYGVNNYNKNVRKLRNEIEKSINLNKVPEYTKVILEQRMKTFGLHTASKSLQSITNDRGLERKISYLKKNATVESFKKDHSNYQNNFIKALKDAYGDNANVNRVIEKIESLDGFKFMAMVAIDDVFDIEYDYKEYTDARLVEIEQKLDLYMDRMRKAEEEQEKNKTKVAKK